MEYGKHLQTLIILFWRRWAHEYLSGGGCGDLVISICCTCFLPPSLDVVWMSLSVLTFLIQLDSEIYCKWNVFLGIKIRTASNLELKGICDNSVFLHTTTFLNFIPVKFFPLNYELICFKSRVNSYCAQFLSLYSETLEFLTSSVFSF